MIVEIVFPRRLAWRLSMAVSCEDRLGTEANYPNGENLLIGNLSEDNGVAGNEPPLREFPGLLIAEGAIASCLNSASEGVIALFLTGVSGRVGELESDILKGYNKDSEQDLKKER